MITSTQIRSCAALYTVPELQEMLRALHLKLQDPDMITSASTGGGTSYTRVQRTPILDLIELYTLTIQYKQTGTIGSQADLGAQFITPIATH